MSFWPEKQGFALESEPSWKEPIHSWQRAADPASDGLQSLYVQSVLPRAAPQARLHNWCQHELICLAAYMQSLVYSKGCSPILQSDVTVQIWTVFIMSQLLKNHGLQNTLSRVVCFKHVWYNLRISFGVVKDDTYGVSWLLILFLSVLSPQLDASVQRTWSALCSSLLFLKY